MKKKPEIKVIVNIRPGEATPAQRKAWDEFWERVIIETNLRKSPNVTDINTQIQTTMSNRKL